MNEQQERKAKFENAQSKAEWIRPELARLVAGGAEGSSDISTDGVDIPS